MRHLVKDAINVKFVTRMTLRQFRSNEKPKSDWNVSTGGIFNSETKQRTIRLFRLHNKITKIINEKVRIQNFPLK